MSTRPRTPAPATPAPGKLPLPELLEMKKRGDKIVMITAYDAPAARIADGAGVELPTKLHVRETFKMMLEKDRTIRHCRLVWSSDTRIGVVFKAD